MKFLALTMLLTSALAARHPRDMASNPCGGGGLYTNAQCCSLDIVNALDTDCNAPLQTPTAKFPISMICAAQGKAPKCCVAPVASVGVLCKDPVGGGM